MTTTSGARSDRGRTGRVGPFALGGVVGTAILVWSVAGGSDRGVDFAVVAAPWFGSVAVLVGIAVFRPRRWFSWALVGAGCVIQSWSVVVLVHSGPGGRHDLPGWPEVISLLAYPSLFCGVVGITSHDDDGWASRSDSAFLAACIGTAVTFLAFARPLLVGDDMPFTESDWVGILALADFVLAAIAIRAVRLDRRPVWSTWLLLAGFVAWGIAHGEVGTRLYDHASPNGTTAAILLVIGPILVGLAALVPEMADEPIVRAERPDDPALPSGAALAGVGVPTAVLLVVYVSRSGGDAARTLFVVLAIAAVAGTLRRLRKLELDEI